MRDIRKKLRIISSRVFGSIMTGAAVKILMTLIRRHVTVAVMSNSLGALFAIFGISAALHFAIDE